LLYRNQPASKDLIHARLKAAGEHTGAKVHAHRLRHTTATQLLPVGCAVTNPQPPDELAASPNYPPKNYFVFVRQRCLVMLLRTCF
jgi:hypothetical protein